MLLYDRKTELKTLATLCDGRPKVKSKLLSSVDESFFHSEAALEAFKRFQSVLRKKGATPSYEDLCSDPTISEESREELIEHRCVPVKTEERLSLLLDNLSQYRRARILFNIADTTFKVMNDDKVDIEGLMDYISSEIYTARAKTSVSKDLLKFGRGSNSKRVIDDLLSNKKANIVPTGFNNFDERNGGFFDGSLVLIAATSGGGKSTLAGQLGLNTAERGFDTCIVPLEMTEKEMTARIAANLSGIDIGKFLQGKLTANEKKKAAKALKAFENKLKKIDTNFNIFEPEEDLTIEEMLMYLKPFKYKMIIIDYISLLKGVDGDDSWQQLGKVARFCKIWAKNNNAIVALLAQLSDEGAIRYSRAIVEHANNAWFWTMTDEQKEEGLINIRQAKARNHNPFPFSLRVEFNTMRVKDIDADDEANFSNAASRVKSDKKKKKVDGAIKGLEDYLRGSGND